MSRLRKSFLDWARLGDGRRLAAQHPPLVDPRTLQPLCGRHLRGRCGAGPDAPCAHSHAPPTISDEVVSRRFEEKAFRADARHPLGLALQERGPAVLISGVERNGLASGAGASGLEGWRVLRVGGVEVSSLREHTAALRRCADDADTCQWEPGQVIDAVGRGPGYTFMYPYINKYRDCKVPVHT